MPPLDGMLSPCGIGKPGQEDDDIGGGDEDVVGGRGGGDVEPCNFSI